MPWLVPGGEVGARAQPGSMRMRAIPPRATLARVSGLRTGYLGLPKSKAGALRSCSFVRSVVNFASGPTLI